MKVSFTSIKWDTDAEDAGLPTSLVLEVESDLDLDTEGADFLSDEMGFCVFSFEYLVL